MVQTTPAPTFSKPQPAATLQISGLNVYYAESHILRDVDMTIPQGKMVCLIGRNGVGKTTL
ncbi:MAG: ATP-binding cassette domain-containing protein, partial [Cyanobacteria bacterium J06631_12]